MRKKQVKVNLRMPRTFSCPDPNSVLLEAGLDAQLGSSLTPAPTAHSFTNGIFQREISAGSIPCGELHSVWSAHTQYTLVIVNLHIQTT